MTICINDNIKSPFCSKTIYIYIYIYIILTIDNISESIFYKLIKENNSI